VGRHWRSGHARRAPDAAREATPKRDVGGRAATSVHGGQFCCLPLSGGPHRAAPNCRANTCRPSIVGESGRRLCYGDVLSARTLVPLCRAMAMEPAHAGAQLHRYSRAVRRHVSYGVRECMCDDGGAGLCRAPPGAHIFLLRLMTPARSELPGSFCARKGMQQKIVRVAVGVLRTPCLFRGAPRLGRDK